MAYQEFLNSWTVVNPEITKVSALEMSLRTVFHIKLPSISQMKVESTISVILFHSCQDGQYQKIVTPQL